MAEVLVRILDGNTFVVSDERGDIEASTTEPTGLFSYDTRFLSTWVLTINGVRLNSLSTDDLQYFEARFFLVPATGTVYIDPKLSVIRERAVGGGFHEELTILNHSDEPADLTVRIDAASDFADLFEVKDALQKMGTYDARVDDGRLILRLPAGARSSGRRRSRRRSRPGSTSAASRSRSSSSRHGTWTTDLDVVHLARGTRHRARPGRSTAGQTARPGRTCSGASTSGWRTRHARVRLGAAEADVPAEPDRPRRAPLLAADRRRPAACRRPACRGS